MRLPSDERPVAAHGEGEYRGTYHHLRRSADLLDGEYARKRLFGAAGKVIADHRRGADRR
ncbi:hypothetical protein [Nonomuraea aurantiaca]|uniref:hypothetical protein n=1 Tax=Nonomuraea aurantiaca TaxID=2878562 RepID=UPI001CD96DF8|nr:hypothetical protein [Nonomuraea aurantiaca]MCA2229510.1 hypothetical protein [Nonomuraea aurantiaca]